MARSKFTHSCGHGGTCDGRNRADADRRASRFATQPCWDCEKQATNAAAQATAQAAGWLALQGTPKQIAYAEALRASKLPKLDEALAILRAALRDGLPLAVQAEMQDALILVEDEIRAETSAKFWIEEPPRDWNRYIQDQLISRNLVPSLHGTTRATTDEG